MSSLRSVLFAGALTALLVASPGSPGQEAIREDASPCTGSAPEPGQSAFWSVAFCNRTGHDVVLQFHDNDCPAQNWSHRGDVYQRLLKRGESANFNLCYADEPKTAARPAPGTPTLRIPGGKGVVTTWNVIGDCGDRSDHLYQDARTFYDRGDYKTGIVLLQYPAGAPHCVMGAAAAAAPAAGAAAANVAAAPASASVPPPPAATASIAQAAVPAAAAAGAAGAATAQAASGAPRAAQPKVSPEQVALRPPAPAADAQRPVITPVIDTSDRFGVTVLVFAANESGHPNYRCKVQLQLGFSDGGSYVDRVQLDIPAGDHDAPVTTRHYGKSVTKVSVGSQKCSTN